MLTIIDESMLLPVDKTNIMMVNPPPTDERFIIKNLGMLYDLLADAVDETNEIFSKQVRQDIKMK